MARNMSTGRNRGTSADQARQRGRQRSIQMREGYDELDDATSPDFQCGPMHGQEDLGRDDEADGDFLQEDTDDQDPAGVVATAEQTDEETADAPTPAGSLAEVIGARPPVVLLRLFLEGELIRARSTTRPRTANAQESLEELRLFVENRFRQGPALLTPAEWKQLLGRETAGIPERLLLLSRLAIGGNARVIVEPQPGEEDAPSGHYRFTPNDRGLERYVGKFAALPDGTPFSLRLLLADNRGKKKEDREQPSPWSQLPWAVKLEALRRILAEEKRHGQAGDDDSFRAKLQEMLEKMGLVIPRPSWDDVKNLREALKRKQLGHRFPNALQRQRAYADPSVEESS